MKNPQIHESWIKEIGDEFQKKYMIKISDFLQGESDAGKTIYPEDKNIFAALNATHFDEVKVVILGQDPYHGEGQAHGLSFSVPDGIKIPPSLKNIFKEIGLPTSHSKTPIDPPLSGGKHELSGNLAPWTQQGVLLLNAILTVRAGEPASHSKIGWQEFSDHIISTLSKQRTGIIFLLWGNFAKGKKSLIDTSKHHVLEAPHPSPFSAHSGFFGCKHFEKVNEILKENGEKEIDWNI